MWTGRGAGERESEQALNSMGATIEPLVCTCHATHIPPFTDLRAAVCIVMSEQPRTNHEGRPGGLYQKVEATRPNSVKIDSNGLLN